MRLWLIRHGETEANVAGLYSGHAPTPLTPKGVAQAQTLHHLLHAVPFDCVLCSELDRARQTAARVLASRDIDIHTTPLLNEMFFGDWEMRHHRDLMHDDPERYAAWCTDWQHAVPTNGEGFQDFSARIEHVVALLQDLKQTQKDVLIASHQGVLSLLIARLLSMPASSLWHFHIDQGCWSRVDMRDDFATLRVLNSRAVWHPDEK